MSNATELADYLELEQPLEIEIEIAQELRRLAEIERKYNEIMAGRFILNSPEDDFKFFNIEIPRRLSNIIKYEGVYTISALVAMTRNDLIKLPNMGVNSICEIEKALGRRGLKLMDAE